GLRWWRLPRVARLLRQRMREIGGITLFPGIGEMLSDLHHRGVALVLVTSNSEENVRSILGPELAALFSTYECSVSLFGKALRFHRICRRSELPRAAILCIGDELRDADAARAEKLAFGAVAWGYAEASVLEQTRPAHLFWNPREIISSIFH
ncbi:MAG: HAD hydrolase-like protein, partial [Chthoniobacteraceae bacterium]